MYVSIQIANNVSVYILTCAYIGAPMASTSNRARSVSARDHSRQWRVRAREHYAPMRMRVRAHTPVGKHVLYRIWNFLALFTHVAQTPDTPTTHASLSHQVGGLS